VERSDKRPACLPNTSKALQNFVSWLYYNTVSQHLSVDDNDVKNEDFFLPMALAALLLNNEKRLPNIYGMINKSMATAPYMQRT
jgi:hypothetical protein